MGMETAFMHGWSLNCSNLKRWKGVAVEIRTEISCTQGVDLANMSPRQGGGPEGQGVGCEAPKTFSMCSTWKVV